MVVRGPLAMNSEDYLGLAADAKHAAHKAIKAREFDRAWGLLHEQKQNYAKHAKKFRFSTAQILALDSSVHEDLANILRIESKHRQAFVHILYWVICAAQPVKKHDKKLKAYFNRCKFTNVSLDDVRVYVSNAKYREDYASIQRQVSTWNSSLETDVR